MYPVKWFLACMVAATAVSASAADIPPLEQRAAWFRHDRFGTIIHWGLYSLIGRGEWVRDTGKIPLEEYNKLVGQFNPQHFDARRWVALIKQAGQKYLVITTKHHDGFCLFHSKLTDYGIQSTPFRRDAIAGDRRRVSSPRAAPGPLLLDHGLAPSRLSAAASLGKEPLHGGRELRPLPGIHAGPDPRNPRPITAASMNCGSTAAGSTKARKISRSSGRSSRKPATCSPTSSSTTAPSPAATTKRPSSSFPPPDSPTKRDGPRSGRPR